VSVRRKKCIKKKNVKRRYKVV